MLCLRLILVVAPITFSQTFRGSSTWSQSSIDMKKNNLVHDELEFMGKEYNVSFELFLKELKPPNADLIHLTPGGNLNNYGDRNPAVFVRNTDGLQFAAAVNGNKNYVFNTGPILKINEWIRISITQLLVNGKYMYEVSVNGEVLHTVENTEAKIICGPVKVYASDPWHNSIEGNIRNFKIHTWYNEDSTPVGVGSKTGCTLHAACDSSWTKFNSHCYKYFEEASIAWTAAKARCEKEGAHLASIHSEEENQFLANLVPKDATGESYVLIGGTDLATQGTFVWTDGSAWDYNAWLPGQPDGLPGEDCTEFKFGGETLWNDQKCTHPRGKFICKKK